MARPRPRPAVAARRRGVGLLEGLEERWRARPPGCRCRCRAPRSARARRRRAGAADSTSTSTTTSPRSVNLIALPTRLVRIWRSRPGSARTAAGSASASRQASSSPLRCARSASSESTSSTISTRSQLDALEPELAGLALREVEDVVDHREQQLARVVHRLGDAPLARREVGLQQQVGHADARRSSACGSRGSCSPGTATSATLASSARRALASASSRGALEGGREARPAPREEDARDDRERRARRRPPPAGCGARGRGPGARPRGSSTRPAGTRRSGAPRSDEAVGRRAAHPLQADGRAAGVRPLGEARGGQGLGGDQRADRFVAGAQRHLGQRVVEPAVLEDRPRAGRAGADRELGLLARGGGGAAPGDEGDRAGPLAERQLLRVEAQGGVVAEIEGRAELRGARDRPVALREARQVTVEEALGRVAGALQPRRAAAPRDPASGPAPGRRGSRRSAGLPPRRA